MKKNRNPTPREKVIMYELFLHKINSFIVSCNNDGIKELVENADNWSYAHRSGEFLTDKQRQKMINDMFQKLCDTPKTDEVTNARQKAWTQLQKETDKQKLFQP